MLKQTCCAAAISLTAVSGASADYIDWYGSGVLTSVTDAQCPTGNFNQSFNKSFSARFLPRNLGSNGPSASLSFLHERYATNFMRSNGMFSLTALEQVSATTVARFGAPYNARLRLTKLVPGTITASTPKIVMEGVIVGYPGFPGNTNCQVTFSLTVFRP